MEKNDEQAASWYRRAADRGDPLGQAALGAARFLGVGVPKDLIEAYKWTSLAAAQENEKARAHLPAIESAMTEGEVERARTRVAAFRPKMASTKRPMARRDALRALGFNRALTELDRLDGPGV